jgi:hypothetical protein
MAEVVVALGVDWRSCYITLAILSEAICSILRAMRPDCEGDYTVFLLKSYKISANDCSALLYKLYAALLGV